MKLNMIIKKFYLFSINADDITFDLFSENNRRLTTNEIISIIF